ncbi:prolipoprotein diacylglyceryl transferase [Senegalia sp. (in: firmicutes)]|uniref:prolipoprotein diacylglyceryl transferase n=1 Tax=Senegalia sp. (in: firmicutes) TaxID=1924098 RepID=UPI003F99489E
MVEAFKIGHFSIYVFGITIALGILVGILVMLKEGKRKKQDVDKLSDLAIYTIIVSLIGARIFYVLAFNLNYYLENPTAIFAIRNGGLSIQGGLIFGITFAIWYSKRKKLNFLSVADTFAPGIIIGQAIGRVGCDVFGIPMESQYFWGVNVNSKLLHPAQIYEVVLDLILFTYLWKKRHNIKYDGELFIKYIIGFSIIRGIVEFFRTNPMVVGPFSIAHITSLIIIIIAIIANNIIKKKNKGKKTQNKTQNNNTKGPIHHYILIAALGIFSVWFYYFIH